MNDPPESRSLIVLAISAMTAGASAALWAMHVV